MDRVHPFVSRLIGVGVRLAPYWVAHAVVVLVTMWWFGPGRIAFLAYWASYPFLLAAHLFARHRYGYRIWTEPVGRPEAAPASASS